MLDRNRITRDLADLEATRADLAQLLSLPQAAFLAERRNLLAVRYLLILAVEAIADLCQHLLAHTHGCSVRDMWIASSKRANRVLSRQPLPNDFGDSLLYATCSSIAIGMLTIPGCMRKPGQT